MLFDNRKQVGFIVFGGGMDKRRWIEDAKAQGYTVLDCGEYAELYVTTKRGE